MPFTHNRPSQGRHTALAYSVNTNGVITTGMLHRIVAVTDDTGPYGSRRTESTESMGIEGGYVFTTNREVINQNNGFNGSGTRSANYSGTTSNGGGNKNVTAEVGQSTFTNLEGAGQGSTKRQFFTSKTATRTISNVVNRTLDGGEIMRDAYGGGASTYATIYAQGATQGTVLTNAHSSRFYSSRTHLQDQEPITRTSSFNRVENTTGTVTRRLSFYYTIKTKPTITTRAVREYVTYNSTVSTYFPGVGNTQISTTKISRATTTNTFSFEDFTTERYLVELKPRSTYKISSIHGGDFWAIGGTRLINDFVINAQTTTVITSANESQLPFNQQFSYNALYTGGGQTININEAVNVSTNSNVKTLTVETVELTKMAIEDQDADNFVDFNTENSQAKVFTTDTYSQSFAVETTTGGIIFTTQVSNYSRANVITSQCESIVSNRTVNFSQTYSGESGMQEATYSSLGTNVGTGIISFQQQRKTGGAGKSYTIKLVSPEDLLRSTNYLVGQKIAYRSIITYDKGLQGGVQYATNNDISAAIGDPKNVTIAHAYVTSTATTSKNAFGSTTSQINVTINTSISGSYLSSNFPLSFKGMLNKYAPFLPTGNYGDIYYSSPDVHVHLDHLQDGSSIIKCTRDFTYNTSKSDSSISTTLDTTLFGIFKVEYGGGGGNYKKTKMYANGLNPFGGGDFTDRNGAVVNMYAPPATYYAFGSNGSTEVAEGLTQIGDGNNFVTNEIPENAMIFMHESVLPFANGRGAIIFNRKQ